MKKSKNRREFLKTAVPAVLLTGCKTLSQPIAPIRSKGGTRKAKSSKTGPKALTQYHPHDLPKEYPGGGGDPSDEVSKLIKWDFEALIHTILQKLENGETDEKVNVYAKTRPQFPSVDTGHPSRSLNVNVEPDIEFTYEKELVVGMVIRGCMARYTGKHHNCSDTEKFDDEFNFTEKTCADAKEAAGHDKYRPIEARTYHLIYSSSSSSYHWGLP